ncbi:rCG27688 [Rattus norvegicus]|uniref:RCG27688 n=1 Tax=Rattus norvegicus TaxID=10116 RepID=A6KBF7_RAT|nr:rCG27688 [Rattus norvegicus]
MDSLDHALSTIRFPWPLGTLAPDLGSLAWLTGNFFPFSLLKEPPQGSIMCRLWRVPDTSERLLPIPFGIPACVPAALLPGSPTERSSLPCTGAALTPFHRLQFSRTEA